MWVNTKCNLKMDLPRFYYALWDIFKEIVRKCKKRNNISNNPVTSIKCKKKVDNHDVVYAVW